MTASFLDSWSFRNVRPLIRHSSQLVETQRSDWRIHSSLRLCYAPFILLQQEQTCFQSKRLAGSLTDEEVPIWLCAAPMATSTCRKAHWVVSKNIIIIRWRRKRGDSLVFSLRLTGVVAKKTDVRVLSWWSFSTLTSTSLYFSLGGIKKCLLNRFTIPGSGTTQINPPFKTKESTHCGPPTAQHCAATSNNRLS